MLSIFIIASAAMHFAKSEDIYLRESRQQCYASGGLFPCTKYRISSLISRLPAVSGQVSGSMRLLEVNDGFSAVNDSFSGVNGSLWSPDATAGRSSEAGTFWGFVGRQVEDFLGRQGVLVTLPQGARYVEDVEAKQPRLKKKGGGGGLLFSLLVLIKLFKLDIVTKLTLLLLLLLKKALIIGGILLYKALKSVEKSCMAKQHHHYYHTQEQQKPSSDYGHYEIVDDSEDLGQQWERNYLKRYYSNLNT